MITSASQRAACMVAAAAILASGGCKKSSKESAEPPTGAARRDASPVAAEKPRRIVVTSIEISTVDPEHKREVYPQLLAKKLAAQLAASGHFAVAVDAVPATHDPEPGVLELLIGYDVITQGLGQKSAFASVKARMRWARSGVEVALREQLVAERPLTKADLGNVDGVVAAHVEQSVATLGKGLIAREKLRVGPVEDVVAALDGSDVSDTLWAMEVVVLRKIHQAHERVVALLGSADHDVRDGAISTLVALGDPKAVDPLTKAAKLGDLGLLRAIIEAVSVLGGPDAEVYLEFVASGHEDEDIKQLAADALARVRARKARASKRPPAKD